MRLLALNIRAGGSGATAPAVVARCLRHDPDVVVLCEYRDNAAGQTFRSALRRAGFEHQAATEWP
jgi:Tfp pilus assembly pilus retraction ATPase PilT